jgi:hypothetical protein
LITYSIFAIAGIRLYSTNFINLVAMDESNVIEIPEFFGSKIKKRYIINADGITIQNVSDVDRPIFIPAASIKAFRYGVKFARGYAFYIGRKYWIEIKYNENEILIIALDSYYKIRLKAYDGAWRSIIKSLWNCYFGEILKEYVIAFNERKEFEIAGFIINSDGVNFGSDVELLWNELAVSYYRTYFMVYKIDDPKIRKSGTLAIDWNASLAQEFFRQLLASYQRQKN